ncbi:MAG: oligosaccharide flippase family protein [Proteobacteria bacterium]|nr:oligosaccharide flippase family protein [Pseudomonadota bacterium]
MSFHLLRASAIYGLANALSAGVPFLLLPILTRVLPPGQYGMVVSFFLLISVANSLAGLNVHGSVAVKWFNREQLDFPRYVGSALVLAGSSSVLCGMLFLGAGLIWRERLGLEPALWPLAALYAGCTVVMGLRTTLWQSQQRAVPSAVFQVLTALLNMGLSLLAVLVLGMGAEGRILGAFWAWLMAAGGAVWLLIAAGDARWSWSRVDLLKLLRFGVPLIPHALAGAVLAGADRFAVSASLGTDALGVYGTAAQVGMVMNVLGDAIQKALSPWMYAQLASGSSVGSLRVVGAFYLLMPMWLLIALVGWLIFLLAGPIILDARYHAAVGLSLWFLAGGAMSASYWTIAGLFFFTSRTEWLSLATVSAAGIAAVLAPVLVARLGVQGGAVSYFCAQSAMLVLAWAVSTKVQPMPWTRPVLALRALRHSGDP